VGAELCHADRQTAMNKPLVAFRNFPKVPKFTRSDHIVCFCVLSGYENKLRVLHYGDLRDYIFYRSFRVLITRSELVI
jgi:hypothetical protein